MPLNRQVVGSIPTASTIRFNNVTAKPAIRFLTLGQRQILERESQSALHSPRWLLRKHKNRTIAQHIRPVTLGQQIAQIQQRFKTARRRRAAYESVGE
jgi:hypothetical protein